MRPMYVLTLDEYGRPLTWRDLGTGSVKHARARSTSRTITRSDRTTVSTTVAVHPLAADRARLKARLLERQLERLGIRTTPKPKPRTASHRGTAIDAARGTFIAT
jgi:hypothetical protein